MGATTQTSTSGPSNPDINATLSKLAEGIGAEYTPGKSIFVGPGATTLAGQQGSLDAAGNPAYGAGLSKALGYYSDVAGGGQLGQNDPGYAALRSKLSNDVLTQTNSSFNGSGLFGSDSNQRAAAEGLTNALGGLDYKQYSDSLNRQTGAAAMLPQLFSAAQLPSSIQQSVGASQDAAAQGKASGPTDYLARLTQILGGASGAGGTTTTSPGTPLWQTLLALGVSAL